MPCHVSFLPSTTSSFIPLFFPSCFHSSFCSALFFPTCLPLFYPYFHFHLVSPYFLCLYFLPSSSPPYFTFFFLLFPFPLPVVSGRFPFLPQFLFSLLWFLASVTFWFLHVSTLLFLSSMFPLLLLFLFCFLLFSSLLQFPFASLQQAFPFFLPSFSFLDCCPPLSSLTSAIPSSEISPFPSLLCLIHISFLCYLAHSFLHISVLYTFLFSISSLPLLFISPSLPHSSVPSPS